MFQGVLEYASSQQESVIHVPGHIFNDSGGTLMLLDYITCQSNASTQLQLSESCYKCL